MTVALLWGFIQFSSDEITVLGRQLSVASFSIFFLCVGYLLHRKRRAKALVAAINLKEGLRLDATQLLGFPHPVYLAFDQSNQKLAQLHRMTGNYETQDFSWVTGWKFEWQQIDRKVSGGVLRIVEGASMNIPPDEIRRRFLRFTLVLTVADERKPVHRFPMNRSTAQAWCARCEAFFGKPLTALA